MNTAKFKYLSGDTFPYQPYPFQCPSGADNHILGLLSISPHLSDKHILVVGSHVPGGEVAETWLTGFVGAGSKQAERRCPTDPDPPDFGGGGLEGGEGGEGGRATGADGSSLSLAAAPGGSCRRRGLPAG